MQTAKLKNQKTVALFWHLTSPILIHSQVMFEEKGMSLMKEQEDHW